MTRDADIDDQEHLEDGQEEAEQPLRNYTLTPWTGKPTVTLLAHRVAQKDGSEPLEIYLPEVPEETQEQLENRALRAYDAARRAEEWIHRTGIIDDWVEQDKENNWKVARAANNHLAFMVQANYLRVYIARAVPDPEESAFLEEFAAAFDIKDSGELGKRLSDFIEIAAEGLADEWAELESGPGSLPETAREWAEFRASREATAAILAAEEERESNPDLDWSEAFHRHLNSIAEDPDTLTVLYERYIDATARSTLEAQNPVEMPLRALRAGLGLDQILKYNLEGRTGEATELALPGILRTPTAPLFRHQAAHLLSTSATRQDILEGIDRRPQEYRSRPGIPQYLDGLSPPETTLDRMSSTLLSQKKNGVALVKMHLQLMNLAYENNGMPFEYDLPENLPALGYKRQSHGGIDSKTLNESRIRLLTLTAQWIETWREDRRGRQREWETPYWIMEGRARDRDYDPDRMMNVLLRDPNPSQFTTVIIRPGAWWQLADMARLHLEIPAEILALPTDGGNATERLMVQLTLVLAGWVRSGQRQHKGKHWDYSIGTLLEAAHVITEQDFKKGSPDTARRLRDRLWSHPESGPIEGDGALPRLNNLGAFNIELLDQEAFWATGRGWRGPFWETKIRLRIPDLGIRSIERASQKKQQRARKK